MKVSPPEANCLMSLNVPGVYVLALYVFSTAGICGV